MAVPEPQLPGPGGFEIVHGQETDQRYPLRFDGLFACLFLPVDDDHGMGDTEVRFPCSPERFQDGPAARQHVINDAERFQSNCPTWYQTVSNSLRWC